MEGTAGPDLGPRRRAPLSTDLLDVEHPQAVTHGEVHGLVGGLVEVLHEGERGVTEAALGRHHAPELEQPHPERVPLEPALERPELHELVRQTERRRLGKTGAAGQLGKTQAPTLGPEDLEQAKGALEDGVTVSLIGPHSLQKLSTT